MKPFSTPLVESIRSCRRIRAQFVGGGSKFGSNAPGMAHELAKRGNTREAIERRMLGANTREASSWAHPRGSTIRLQEPETRRRCQRIDLTEPAPRQSPLADNSARRSTKPGS